MRALAPVLAAALALHATPAPAAPAAPALMVNVRGEPSIRVEDRRATLLPKMSEWRVRKLLGAPEKWWWYGDDHVVRKFDYRAYGLRVTFHGQTVLRYEVYLRPREVDAQYNAQAKDGWTYQGIDMKEHLEGYKPAPARFDVPIRAGMSPAEVIKAMGGRQHLREQATVRYGFDQGRGDLVYFFVGDRLCEVSISR